MKRLIVFTFIFLLLPKAFAFAGLEINEVMYDLKTGGDTGREWIEIFNNSSSAVDLSNYKLFEADTNHKLTLTAGSATLPPMSYALIVSDFNKFKVDWPNLASNIFDSTFSLSNTGESLAIKDEKLNVVDQFTYKSSMGGAGNGNSLQKINGTWLSEPPTIGGENKIVSVSPPTPLVKTIVAKTTTSKASVGEVSAPKEVNTAPQITPTIEKTSNKYTFPIFLGVFIIFSSFLVFWIRKPSKISTEGDDFEILD